MSSNVRISHTGSGSSNSLVRLGDFEYNLSSTITRVGAFMGDLETFGCAGCKSIELHSFSEAANGSASISVSSLGSTNVE